MTTARSPLPPRGGLGALLARHGRATYVNFLTEEEGGERIHAAYGRHYERLARVKAAWDPTNLFRQNKNIPPSRP